MDEKITIIIGAGGSLSDAANKPIAMRPPLDNGFFASLKKSGYEKNPDFKEVITYLDEIYSIDPLVETDDSLERMMAILYSDMQSSPHKSQAANAFRSFIRIINKRISETTNQINPGSKGNFYRLIIKLLSRGIKAENITVITFNYDLQIEKSLDLIQNTAKWKKYGNIFNFPYCYRLPNYKITQAPKSEPVFNKSSDDEAPCIKVLKLHGSLNWFSRHTSPDPSPRSLLNTKRDIYITPRKKPLSNLRFRGKKRLYTFPIVVPPVINKAAILHADLVGIWKIAQESLQASTKIIVFGYSCPQSDYESANLISRSIRKNKSLISFSVIDPSTSAFERFVSLTNLSRMYYARNMTAFSDAIDGF